VPDKNYKVIWKWRVTIGKWTVKFEDGKGAIEVNKDHMDGEKLLSLWTSSPICYQIYNMDFILFILNQ
jgi:hypothetical protein